LKNVLKQTILTKRDNGDARFAYSRVASAFAAGYLANSWQPTSTRGAADGAERGLFSMLGDAGYFALQEFIPFTRNSIFRRHP
jgi:hypothetical protein